jgi:hypothetical protein
LIGKPPSHPWWQHVPQDQRQKLQRQRRWLHLVAWLRIRGNQIKLMLGLYLLLCLVPLCLGLYTLVAFAILPLLLVPPVALLIYWLVWKEFHD